MPSDLGVRHLQCSRRNAPWDQTFNITNPRRDGLGTAGVPTAGEGGEFPRMLSNHSSHNPSTVRVA